jgi:trk/ktr system potassium uptake protein
MARRSNLLTARVVGVCAVGLIGQMAVDVPGGYFGPRDTVSLLGGAFAVALLVVSGAITLVLRRGSGRRGLLPPVLYAALVGFFVPALAADPVVAGAVVVYCIALLLQHFFPPPPPSARRQAGDVRRLARLEAIGPALRHLILISLALTVAVVGYHLSGHLLSQFVLLFVDLGCLILAWPLLWEGVGSRRPDRARSGRWLAAAGGVVVALVLLSRVAPLLWLMALSLLLCGVLLRTLGQERITLEVLHSFYDRPSQLIGISFAALILIGTLLLTFPAAAGDRALSPLDALFTATSASCVTGLIVLDTPSAFSHFGQVVILLLIQIGGLGIMTLSTFATLLLGGTLGLRGERALHRVLDLQTPTNAYRLTRFVVLATLAIEGLGTVVLTLCFRSAGFGWGASLWRGIFHAVSAFCNAGFALQTDSITLFQDQPVALLAVSGLIVTGGVGFVVLAALWGRLTMPGRRPVSVQVKVVAAATAALVVGGAVLFALIEWNGSLAGQSTIDRLANALFQSITLRTAGFNSIDLASTHPASRLFMMMLMFVGGAPGSTAGGIKVTTAVILLAALRASSRSQGPVVLFRREIPHDVVYRSLAILVLSTTAITLTFFALLLVESQPFQVLLFESVSAFGTVGLSLGATAELSALGRLIVVAAMFIGRIGPLTLALLLGSAEVRRAELRFPESRLMVG